MYTYLQPPGNNTQSKFLSFLYCVFTPLLNPLIDTLRNKDVREAWRKSLLSQTE